MNVLLYRVGRNLNRVYRTAEAFGVERLLLLECTGELQGNLFKATDRVAMERLASWPSTVGLLALDAHVQGPIWRVDWGRVHTIAIGGETHGLPHRRLAEQYAAIPTVGQVADLTVEAALAIALYEWRRGESV